MNKPLVSIIIPTYNEEKSISDALQTLQNQTYRPVEVIIVDDGSTDKTLDVLSKLQVTSDKLQVIKQNHKGPGAARNLGASKAKGEILVFVDADMTFDQKFVEMLIKPIRENKVVGTFSKEEFLKNKDNLWTLCWNINRANASDELIGSAQKLKGFIFNLFAKSDPARMIQENSANTAPTFRAIKKEEFLKVGGFDPTGEYTDDWSVGRKLGAHSVAAPGAIYYHANPASLAEIWKQARWIGKNEFISGTLMRRLKSLIRYSLPLSLVIGVIKSVVILRQAQDDGERSRTISRQLLFVPFKLYYDFAIFTSVVLSFLGEKKFK